MRSYSARSWAGVVLFTVVGVPAIGRAFARSTWAWPFDVVAAVGCVGMVVVCLLARVEIDDVGVARRPGRLRIPWTGIARFEPHPRPELVRGIRVVRTTGRRAALTQFWIKPARGRELLDALNAELSASRSG